MFCFVRCTVRRLISVMNPVLDSRLVTFPLRVLLLHEVRVLDELTQASGDQCCGATVGKSVVERAGQGKHRSDLGPPVDCHDLVGDRPDLRKEERDKSTMNERKVPGTTHKQASKERREGDTATVQAQQ